MLPKFCLLYVIAAGCACAAPGTPLVAIQVTEAAGIRRTAFPADARMHFAQGSLRSDRNARLMFHDKETPAQYTAEALWPDGSVEWLDVDWNVSIAPGDTQAYGLEYGPNVTAAGVPRGLTVTEDDAGIQVGSVRFSKSGNPLMLSVKYRNEDIGQGINGVFVTDETGHRHDLSEATSLKTEIVKRGPLVVELRYSGSLKNVPFAITVEMPNSKSWVKISASVNDPAGRLREIGIGTPLALGPMPHVWDFGTSRWTYGSLRRAEDSVTLTQSPEGEWNVTTGPEGKQTLYEKSPAGRTEPVQWAHFQDGKEVVAFAIGRTAQQTGTWRMTFDGDGQATFRFAPSAPNPREEITVYEHFVAAPVQIGAATSPSAILSPLIVSVSGDAAVR